MTKEKLQLIDFSKLQDLYVRLLKYIKFNDDTIEYELKYTQKNGIVYMLNRLSTNGWTLPDNSTVVKIEFKTISELELKLAILGV